MVRQVADQFAKFKRAFIIIDLSKPSHSIHKLLTLAKRKKELFDKEL